MKFTELRTGHIVGIVDAYGAVHSEFTGDKVLFHEEKWPQKTHCRWRWNFSNSVYFIGGEKPSVEEYDAITRHIEKKYGIPFWDNGHHDMDYFLAKLREERAEGV